jgi:hypothetical protein
MKIFRNVRQKLAAENLPDWQAGNKNFMYQITNGQQGEDVQLSKAEVTELLKNRKHKNGFAMATYEFPFMITELEEMKTLCKRIISLINKELAKG